MCCVYILYGSHIDPSQYFAMARIMFIVVISILFLIHETQSGLVDVKLWRDSRQADPKEKSSKGGKPDTGKTAECHIADISFVIDSSASIRRKDFQTGLEFVANFTKNFIVGPENVRVSAVTYGHKIFEHFGFDYALSNENLTEAILSITHKGGSKTETGMAIKYMREKQMVLARPGVQKVGIVITDGKSQDKEFTMKEAKKTKLTGITMIAIGVGKGTDRAELNAIASSEKDVFHVQNYDSLGSITSELETKACAVTTTPVPMEQACGLRAPADINFVFDAAYNGGPKTEQIIKFIEEVVSQDDMQEGMQVGCITSQCKNINGFKLNEYTDIADIRAHLDKYTQSHLSKIVQEMTENGFSQANGAREFAKHIAVTFVSGKVPLKELKQAAKGAIQNDVVNYVVNLGDYAKSDLVDMAYQNSEDYVLSGAPMTDLARKFVNHICDKETPV